MPSEAIEIIDNKVVSFTHRGWSIGGFDEKENALHERQIEASAVALSLQMVLGNREKIRDATRLEMSNNNENNARMGSW